jgi:hypothetical protein
MQSLRSTCHALDPRFAERQRPSVDNPTGWHDHDSTPHAAAGERGPAVGLFHVWSHNLHPYCCCQWPYSDLRLVLLYITVNSIASTESIVRSIAREACLIMSKSVHCSADDGTGFCFKKRGGESHRSAKNLEGSASFKSMQRSSAKHRLGAC